MQSCYDHHTSNMCKEEPTSSLNMKGVEEGVFRRPRAPLKRTYSSQLSECVKVFCGVCDQIVNLSGIRKHLFNIHKMGRNNYIKLYGNPKTQIIKMVHHQCGICRQDVVLDYDALSKHLKTVHKLKGQGLTEYNSQHLKMIRVSKSMRAVKVDTSNPATTFMTPKVSPTPEGPVEAPTTTPPSTTNPRLAPVPTCNLCTRLFRSNMQLKMHMRREHADS